MKIIVSSLIGILVACLPVLSQENSLQAENTPSAFVKNDNIVVKLYDGQERQLTFTGMDESPVLNPSGDKVIFVRNEKVIQGQQEYVRKKIMTVGVNDYLEKTISNQKPYKDGKNNTTEILRIDNPAISSDGNYLFFLTNHTATTSQVIRLELATGKWDLLFSAEYFELLNAGPFKDYFLIGRQEIGAAGQGIYYYMVDATGKKVKEFSSRDNMEQFKKSIQQ